MLLPWTPLLFLLFRAENAGNNSLGVCIRFCRAWVIFPLLFFSVSRAKGGYYLLMVLPAIALLLGIEITRRSHIVMDRALSWCIGITSLLVTGAFTIALIYESHFQWPSGRMTSETASVLACASVWVIYSCRQLILKKQSEMRDIAIFAIGLVTMPLLTMVLHAEQARSATNSSEEIAALIESQPISSQKVFVYRHYEDVFSSLPFYLGKKVKVINSVSADLQFGCRVTHGEQSACLSLLEFDHERADSPVAVAVANEDLDDFYRLTGRHKWRNVSVGDRHVLFNY
jgi:4-amino-4-deoxy-L-arabinose transferase-like glycosyltransferase